MLHLLSQPFFKSGEGIGKVLEFAGDGVARCALDERATLTNMAVEAGGFTGIIEADEVVVDVPRRSSAALDADDVRARIVRADPGATLLRDVRDRPRRRRADGRDARRPAQRRAARAQLSGGDVKIDIAYGGSCTGGKKADMDMYASRPGRARSRAASRSPPGVHLYIQFGSQDIRRYAEAKGYLEVFERAGAELVDPSCGACIKAGPGVERLAGPGHGERAEPQLPRPERPGQGLPREPARRRRERHRRQNRAAVVPFEGAGAPSSSSREDQTLMTWPSADRRPQCGRRLRLSRFGRNAASRPIAGRNEQMRYVRAMPRASAMRPSTAAPVPAIPNEKPKNSPEIIPTRPGTSSCP